MIGKRRSLMIETERQDKVQARERKQSGRWWEHENKGDTEIKQSEIIMLIIFKNPKYDVKYS